MLDAANGEVVTLILEKSNHMFLKEGKNLTHFFHYDLCSYY